jgi:hypothetical protein
MTVDAARIYPDRSLSYEFEPLEENADTSYIEEEQYYEGGEWSVSQVRFVAAHGYQANIYLFQGQAGEALEPRQASSILRSKVLHARVTDDGHVVVSADMIRALGLSPGDEIELQIVGPSTRRSMRGLVAGRSNVSEADIAEVRSEMWENFPKDLP